MLYSIYGAGVETPISPVIKVIYNLNSGPSGLISTRCIAYGIFNRLVISKGMVKYSGCGVRGRCFIKEKILEMSGNFNYS